MKLTDPAKTQIPASGWPRWSVTRPEIRPPLAGGGPVGGEGVGEGVGEGPAGGGGVGEGPAGEGPAGRAASGPAGESARTLASSDIACWTGVAAGAEGPADSTGRRSVTGATGVRPDPLTSTDTEPVRVIVPPYHCGT